VEIGRLAASVAGQPLEGSVTVSRFADPQVRFAMRGALDLDAVAPMVAPRGTRLGGRAALDVQGAGRVKDPGSVVLQGSADLAAVTVASPSMPKPLDQVNGRIAFAPDRATVRGLTGHAGRS